MEEVWKDIKDYEGLYQVSNLGRVKSLDRKVVQFNGFCNIERIYKGRILKPSTSANGYKRVILYDKCKKKNVNIHKLVLLAFVPNTENLAQINHIDEDKSNNCVNNLEWCSSKYNINYGKRNQKTSEALKGKAKSKEHKEKLSNIAKKRIIIRNEKGQIETYLPAVNK